MIDIPDYSSVSAIKGYWFVFIDNDQKIALHASAFTGQERIFVGGELVSQKRSLGLKSNHQFRQGNDSYELILHVKKILNLEIDCHLIKNEAKIGAFKATIDKKIFRKIIIVSAVSGAIVGAFFSIGLPLDVSLSLLAAYCIAISFYSFVNATTGKMFIVHKVEL
jgi:hypothetical protein